MLYYLLLLFIISFSIVYNFKNKFSEVPIVQEVWSWDKRNGISETIEDPRENKKGKESSPFKILNGYLTQNKKPFILKSKTTFQGEDGDLFEVPPLGNGFLAYKKIGDKITYYSKNGEVLWKKSFQSIPFSSYTGNIHHMVSGDGNQVLLVDMDGNKTGAKQLDGRFLTDLSTSTLAGSLILFSGGEVYRLDMNGNLLYSYNDINNKNFTFYKSSGLSENGKYVSLHFMENDFDYIKMIDETKREVYKIKLDSIYPHKIYIAVSNQGSTLLNLTDKIVIYSNTGTLIKEIKKIQKEDVYQVAFVTKSIFCVNKSDELIFLTESGEIIKRKKIFTNQFRIFPSKNENNFFLENNYSILQFRLFN
jgi:hypothetical protein